MTSKMKKLLALVMALCCLLLCACGPTETPPETTGGSGEQQPTGDNSGNTSSGIPDVDLGGFEFIMADWWSDPVPEEVEPDSAWEQMVQDYHKQLETDMNFDFKQIGLQNQGDFSQVLIDSLIQNKPLCSAFQMKLQDFTAMAAQGLLYDLGSLEVFDFENDPKWSQTIIDYFTIGGKIYAARPSEDQPRLGIYFNKRLFEEAGIDPEQPYDLQAAGQWDWAHFEELCTKLTRDTNNDGVTDIYAFGGNDCPKDFDTAFISQEVIVDVDGTVRLGTCTPVPCCISPFENTNKYQPTPAEEGSARYERVMDKLSGNYYGPNIAPTDPTEEETTGETTVATEETAGDVTEVPEEETEASTDETTAPAEEDSGE